MSSFDPTIYRDSTESNGSRSMPTGFLEFLGKKSIAEVTLGGHVSGEMTTMFSDIRSFSPIARNNPPPDVFDFVNTYFGWVVPVIRDHGGFVVKYLGDGIFAIFPNKADDAVRAGIGQLEQVQSYNASRQEHGQSPIRIGIGLYTAHITVGMVGEDIGMHGDAFDVNLASRLEGLKVLRGILVAQRGYL